MTYKINDILKIKELEDRIKILELIKKQKDKIFYITSIIFFTICFSAFLYTCYKSF